MKKLAKWIGVFFGAIVGVALLGAAAVWIYLTFATHEPDKVLPLDGLSERLATDVPELQRVYAVPGVAVGVIAEGRVWKTWNFGAADRERGIAVDDNTVFGVASVSKAVTAWGVWHLVKTGAIELDAPVSRYLKRWQLPPSKFDNDAVTVRALLSHKAGLSRQRLDGYVPLDEALPSIPEWLAAHPEAPVKVERKPGGEEYSNAGYLILQMMIEDVTGRPFADYMRDEVLVPLGMTSSSFVMDEATKAKIAEWYEVDGSVVGPRMQMVEVAAAGFNTTLDDLMKFTIANLSYDTDRTAGVIPLDALKAMRTHPGGFDNMNLGYEFVERLPRFHLHAVRFVGHSGGGRGWSAVMAMVPSTGDALVVMQNTPNAVYPQILCTWANVRFGVDCADDSPPVAIPQRLLDELAGVYTVPGQPDIELRANNGVLALRQEQIIFSLVTSTDQKTFRTLFAPITFTVERADDGLVTGLKMRQMIIRSFVATRSR